MADKKQISVFLVDDNEIYLEMIEQHLKQHPQYAIEKYYTGESAMNGLHRDPDIIILDYFLDSENADAMNGLDVLKQIKKVKPDIPVVMLTKLEKVDVAVNSVKSGAYDYVVKNDTAFTRIENLINNIGYNIEIERKLDTYKVANNIIIAALLIIILGTIVAYFVFPQYF